MMFGLQLVAVLAVLGPAAAQSTLYSNGGCRITGPGAEVNVTCTCRQTLQQTLDSPPINYLEIVGCITDGPAAAETMRLSFVQPLSDSAADFVLLRVRSVNISQIKLALDPVRGRLEAATHPLQRLHIELSSLPDGLQDGALQGLQNLRHVSLEFVETIHVSQSALADLPQLRSLTVTGCTFTFVSPRMLARTPRLRQLRFTNSRFDFLRSDAITVENDVDDADDADDDTCPSDASVSLLTTPTPNAASVYFANNSVLTMQTSAIRVSAVRQLVVSSNNIQEMYPGALNITLRSAGCRPVLQFTRNEVVDMRRGALFVANEAGTPADLLLGGNSLAREALSPRLLQLRGPFQRRRVAGLPADQYECSCCECSSTQRLIDVALQEQPDQLEKDVFVAGLATARCFDEPDRWFLQFAGTCVPDANLTKRVHELVPEWLPGPQKAAAARLPAATVLPLLLLTLAAAVRG